jgi:OsmC subfamily peroxiredoxin
VGRSHRGAERKDEPEELVAAAHASCFAMALALVLGKANATPEQLVVRAACTLDEVAGAPRITRSALEVHGRVSNLDEGAFAEAVDEASRLCPVSNALTGNVEITVGRRSKVRGRRRWTLSTRSFAPLCVGIAFEMEPSPDSHVNGSAIASET